MNTFTKLECEACKAQPRPIRRAAGYRWLDSEGKRRDWCSCCYERFAYEDSFHIASGLSDIVKTWTLTHAMQDYTGIPIWNSTDLA